MALVTSLIRYPVALALGMFWFIAHKVFVLLVDWKCAKQVHTEQVTDVKESVVNVITEQDIFSVSDG